MVNTKPAIKTVVFDLGRVLVHIATTGDKFGRLMRGLGVEPDQAFAKYWNQPEVLRHMTGEMSPREFYLASNRRSGSELDYESFVEAWCDIFEPDFAMGRLFERVAARYRVGILSDTDPLHWEKVKTLMPWLAAAETPTLSFRVGKLKPDPAMFLAAAADNGCRPEECLFIDDIPGNVEGARKAGMTALRFEGAEKLAADLRGLGIL